jgi:hypothetical protein
LILAFAWRTEENDKIIKKIRNPLRIRSVMIEIQTRHILNISLECDCYTCLLGLTLREKNTDGDRKGC